MLKRQAEEHRLKALTEYFFRARTRARPEVAAFANKVAELGSVAVIGGMLRDLYIDGNRKFVSDVDLVVDPLSLSEFDRLMSGYRVKINRFGGYGLRLGRWRVDIWPLERTWAAVHGYVEVQDLRDLVKVTFFDWDAIIYDFRERAIYSGEQWYSKVDNRILDINLQPNPNPLGNSVRALRYAWRWNAKLGPRLAEHVYKQLCEAGWETLLQAERSSFHSGILRYLDAKQIHLALRAAERSGWPLSVDLRLSGKNQEFAFGQQ